MAGVMWRELTRRMINKTFDRWIAQNRRQIFSIRLEWPKIEFLCCLGGYRRTPPASSRPLDHTSTGYLRGRHLYSLALPDTERIGRGLILCQDRASIVGRAGFDHRVDNLQPGKTNCAACSRWLGDKKNKKKHTHTHTHIFPFFPTAEVREIFQLFF